MNPCGNGSLQTGTKIIAIVQLVCSICWIGLFGAAAVSKGMNRNTHFTYFTSAVLEDTDSHQRAIGLKLILASIHPVVVAVMYLVMSIILLHGANKRNRKMCMIWFVLNATSFIGIGPSGFGFASEYADTSAGVYGLGPLGVQLYFMWVVWVFMTELKEGEGIVGSKTFNPQPPHNIPDASCPTLQPQTFPPPQYSASP